MEKTMKRTLSLLLVLCLVFQLQPTFVWADEKESQSTETEAYEEKYFSDFTADDVLCEITEQRTETEKHFQMADGSNLAVAYAYPVHYLDDTGTYQDIDNSLALYNEDGTPSDEGVEIPKGSDDRRVYKNKNGKAEISLALLSDAEKLASISYAGYTVSLSPLNEQAQSSEPSAEPPIVGRLEKLKDTAVLSSLETAILPESTASIVTYDGLLGNADLAYTADGCALKEDIIVNKRAEEYVYRFTLFSDGLTPLALETGSIELRDAAGDSVFYLPAGNMFDAAGASSDEVQYKLDDNGDGTYTLAVIADKEWINAHERQFPVTIDPPVVINGFFNIETGTIFQWIPNGAGGQRSAESLGWFNGSYARILVRVNNLPTLPDNSYVVYSSICLYECAYSYGGLSSMDIEAHALLSNTPTIQGTEEYWCLYHTWNDCPAQSSTVTDFVNVNSTHQFRSFEVTREAIKWYKDSSTNYGFCLKAALEGSMTSSSCANMHFSSSNLQNGSSRPYFVVHYRNNIGLEDYYSYQSHGIDRAGTGYIGDYSGQLTLVKTDVAAAGTVNPVVISHVYNSAYSGGNYEAIPNSGSLYASTKLGPGWKLNLQQSITVTGSSLAYIDGDGTVHYFNASGSVYKDEDGLGLTISGSGGNYTLTDLKGNTKQFIGGMLKSMTDSNGNLITLDYTGSQITAVKRQNDGGSMETIATLSYTSGGYLIGITDGAGKTTSFSYNGILLSQVTHPDGAKANYGYTSGKLSSATDAESGYAVYYEYGAAGRISKFYEKSGSTIGASVGVTSGEGLQIYRSSGKDRVLNNSDDLISSYVFDYYGRTITSSLTNVDGTVTYGASAAQYKINSGVTLTNNHLTVSSEVGMRPVGSTSGYTFLSTNLLDSTDPSSTTGWTGGTRQTDSRFGYALKVTGAIGGTREVTKTVTIPEASRLNKTYSLSAWAKADSVALSDSSRTFLLRATLIYTDNQTEVKELSFCPDSLEWQYNALPLVPQRSVGVKQIKVSFLFNNNPNTALFTNACLTVDSAQSYAYDSNGNLTSVAVPGNTTASYTYSGADLISQVTRGNVTFSYGYDSAHNVTSVSSSGLSMAITRDAKGNATATTLTGSGTSAKITSSAGYDSNGNLLTSQTDSRGNSVTYTYGDNGSKLYGQPTAIKDPKNTTINYTYNASNRRPTGASIASTVSLSYTYGSGHLTGLSRTAGSSTQSYAMTYDGFGNLTSVKVGTRTLASWSYGTKNMALASTTYGNGNSFTYVYDPLERVTGVRYNGSSSNALSYAYWGEGTLKNLTDSVNNRSYDYTYDTLGRLTGLTEKYGSTTVHYYTATWDAANRISGLSYQVSPSWSSTLNAARNYIYTYDSTNGLLNSMTAPYGSLTYSYDGLKRLSSRTTKNSSGTTLYTRTYGYLAGSGTNVSTTLVSSLSNGSFGSYSYTYDANGNITAISGSTAASYTYDSQNRLLTEVRGGTTYSYSYDGAGNLLSKTKTTGSGTDSYTYGDSTWKDLLTAYNGSSITYDAVGNPTQWYDGSTMSWVNGRRLASISAVSGGHAAMSFTYDADGLRLTKTVGSTTHKYLWQGGQLVSENWGSNSLEFFYDESGRPYALLYNGTIYYYITNLQGDVVKIVNASGSSVAEYSYNAWGEVLTATGTLASVNPLRYRGYYYDSESGFYYVKSRYYDPKICRFINADIFASTGQGFTGCNMFAYCNDNPVNSVDQDGSKSVATLLLELWINGEGEAQTFEEGSFISQKISRSHTFQREVEEKIADYKQGGASSLKAQSIGFFAPEYDLWLGIRRANYDISITEEVSTFHFLWFEFTQSRYVATIRIYDTYDFNRGDETGDGIGSILNNIGYSAQETGIGTQFSWETYITYKTEWRWYGK